MDLQMIYLVLGSVATILFVILSICGNGYYSLVENLDSGDFPLKSIYVVGFVWSSLPFLSMKGKTREKLIGQAKLLYGNQYAEYYANVVWAQALSIVHLCVAAGLLAAGLMNSALMLLIGLGTAVFMAYTFLNNMNDQLQTRELECATELPEIVSTMALLINAGMMLRNAWRSIAESKDGVAYTLMRQSCVDMDNGMSDVDAIHKFGTLSNSAEVRKFTSALAQSMERGGGELNTFLSRQSIEIWTLKKQLMLQKGEAAASKLLAPTAMLFVGIIIAVFAGALGMLL